MTIDRMDLMALIEKGADAARFGATAPVAKPSTFFFSTGRRCRQAKADRASAHG